MGDASSVAGCVPGSDPSSISSTLLERLKARRPEAWQRLVDLYGPVVYRWCRWSGVLAGDVPDVVQEVFTAVAAHIADFHRQRPGDSFTGWLRTITRNKVTDHFRAAGASLRPGWHRCPSGDAGYWPSVGVRH